MILFRAMLLNRSSRAVTTKQANLMTDHHTASQSSSPTQNYTKPLSSFFVSPLRFKAFTFNKGTMPDSEVPLISPTSILVPFSPNKNPFSKKFPETKHYYYCYSCVKLDSKGIGVALLGEEEDDEKTSSPNKSSTKMVLFGTKLLNVQIPPPPTNFTADFGIKTRNSTSGFENCTSNSQISHQVLTGCVSMSELEMSEDYTYVISYDGSNPNPKTTHIYDNCILENCSSQSADHKLPPKAKTFLSFCHTCDKKLEQKNDIFIYRGDEAFCSQECRYRKMVLDGIES